MSTRFFCLREKSRLSFLWRCRGSELTNRASAFDVVRQFEDALAEYTGAPHAVAVDSCTNAIFLSLLWWRSTGPTRRVVQLPRRTYVGVAQAVLNAGLEIEWHDEPWSGHYSLNGAPIWDSARRFTADMYRSIADFYFPDSAPLVCVSFQIAKILPIGRGGAVLTDNAETATWLRRARFDGRTPGDDAAPIQVPGFHMYLTPDAAARGLWLLSWLPRHNEDLPNDDYPDLSLIFGEQPATV